MWVDILCDFDSREFPALSPQVSQERLILPADLPPRTISVLELDFDDGANAALEIRDEPIGLRPAFTCRAFLGENDPRAWEIILRDPAQVVVNPRFVENASTLSSPGSLTSL